MAGTPISKLPSDASAALTDLTAVVQNSVTYAYAFSEIVALFNRNNASVTAANIPQFNGTTGVLQDSGVGWSSFYNGKIYSITDSGIANAYAGSYQLSVASSLGAATGMIIALTVSHTNTGVSTFALNGGSPLSIVQNDGVTAIQAGMMRAGASAHLYCLGTSYQLLNPFISGPATFRAHSTASFSPGNNTPTLLVLETTDFDTASAYNNTATGNGYSYTPNIAGFYRFTASFQFNFTGSGTATLALYKNGSPVSISTGLDVTATTESYIVSVNDIIQCNGTTDFIQVFASFNNQSNATTCTSSTVFFCGEKAA